MLHFEIFGEQALNGNFGVGIERFVFIGFQFFPKSILDNIVSTGRHVHFFEFFLDGIILFCAGIDSIGGTFSLVHGLLQFARQFNVNFIEMTILVRRIILDSVIRHKLVHHMHHLVEDFLHHGVA